MSTNRIPWGELRRVAGDFATEPPHLEFDALTARMPVENYQRSFTGWSDQAADEAAEAAAAADPTGIAAPVPSCRAALDRRLAGLRRRLPFAHLPGLSRHARTCRARAASRSTPSTASPATSCRSSSRSSPTALVCAFDLSGPTFRHELYDALQGRPRRDARGARRPDSQDSSRCSRRWRFRSSRAPGYEADDVLATLARLCDEGGRQVLPRHRRQGLPAAASPTASPSTTSARTKCTMPRRSSATGASRPEQVVDFQALVGDKVDNVPGVPLIGPKIGQGAARKIRHARKRARPRRRSPRRQSGSRTSWSTARRRCCRASSSRSTATCRSCRRLECRPRRRVRPAAARRAVPRLRLPLARRPRWRA